MTEIPSPATQIDPLHLGGALFQRNSEPMWIYSTDTLHFLAVNDAAVNKYGYSQAEFLSLTLADIRPEEDISDLKHSVRELPLQSQSSGIWRHRSRDGRLFWADTFSHAVVFQGRAARLVTARDVSDQRAAEETLWRERSLTDAIVETAGVLIVVLDRQGRIVRFNRSCESLTGYRAEEVIGKEFWHLFVKPEDVAPVLAVLDCLYAGQYPNSHENPWLTKDGSERLISWTNTVLTSPDGDVEFVIATGLDITEQRRAEHELRRTQEQYQGIVENAVEGIFQTTPDGRYLSANPALARIYGYESPDDLMTRLDDIAMGLYIDPRRRDEFTARMHADGIVEDFESLVRRKDGQTIWISESARAVRCAEGGVQYYEGIVKDITERKTLEAERERLLADAIERADRDPLTGLLNHRAFHARLEEETDRALRKSKSLAIALLDLDNFGFFNDVYGHAVGDDVLRRVAHVLQNVCHGADVVARFAGDEFALLLPDTGGAEAAARLSECLGQLAEAGYRPPGYDCVVPLNLSLGLAVLPEDGETRQDVLQTAEGRLLRVKTGGDGDAPTAWLRETLTRTVEGFSMLDALVTAVDNKDRYTRRHSEDVMMHSIAIGRELGLSDLEMRYLQTAALLHDVGKIGVPDRVLRKPGHLAPDEFEAIKQHPMMGSAIVGAVPGFEGTLEAIRHHHERWDGAGYPFGLRGAETPLAARIMAVADAYSAMTTNRPYRKGMQPQQALAILEEGTETQWDPECVRAFLRSRARRKGSVLACAA